VREFRRRVRLALEEHHLLPGDPYRVFSAFAGRERPGEPVPEPPPDPTRIKPQEANPFIAE